MPVPHSRFDTRSTPAALAHDRWRALIGVLFDAQPVMEGEHGFSVQLDAWRVDDVGLALMTASPHRFSRSRAKISRDGMDGYLLQFYTAGESRDWGGDYAAGAGDLYVIDMAQPVSTLTTRHSHIDIVVPRRRLAEQLRTPDQCHERVLPAGLPLVTLLRDMALSYLRQLPFLSAADASAALTPLIGLAAAAINGTAGDDHATAVRTGLFVQIRRFIDNRLLDPGLSVDLILVRFGLSRRSLYRLFEPVGGVDAYIKKRRLAMAQRALKDPANSALSIADIATMHGFASAEHFTRSFRGAFGVTPREMRFYAPAESGGGTADIPDAAWSRWIAEIGR
ncbi:AraC-like DNA-binding protein [Azospirillum fermentarium]|uniref:helix-turn-helix domain-containing protein n=1 Tax=Azospirillum fermentarium TaxID=1233114 RepID=UPI0022264DD6|nr:helix-turn-helix domain-containing protein [Azospirillum fermentarium]MCW2244447.1 AraC-like DNA-binding protein [Azospirillum fermentarium]